MITLNSPQSHHLQLHQGQQPFIFTSYCLTMFPLNSEKQTGIKRFALHIDRNRLLLVGGVALHLSIEMLQDHKQQPGC